MYDYVIVGAGITGLTIARILAEAGKRILVVDKRSHIGGNCYDHYNDKGILIHKYGPHIFHTRHREIWEFLSRFTKWRLYQHKVKAFVGGKLISFPINLKTIQQLYNMKFTPEEMKEYLASVRVPIENPSNAREAVIAQVGEDLYEKFFKNYTRKQWGVDAEELSPLITKRIPIRFSNDERYFDDPYQGMPLNGYTEMFTRMCKHHGIHLMLQVEFKELPGGIRFNRLVYTGPIDEYFGYKYGKLQYRSLEFEFRTFTTESYQEVAVVNYPNDYDFTRITEYKKLTGQDTHLTTVSFEYPTDEGEPYYPVIRGENEELREKYLKMARRLKTVFFAGRLGSYRYLNMDIACLEGMNLAKELLK